MNNELLNLLKTKKVDIKTLTTKYVDDNVKYNNMYKSKHFIKYRDYSYMLTPEEFDYLRGIFYEN